MNRPEDREDNPIGKSFKQERMTSDQPQEQPQPNDSVSYSASLDYNAIESDKGTNPYAAVAFVATIAMASTYSPPAHAGIDSILSSLVGKFKSMFEPLLNNVFGIFGEMLNAGQADSSAAVIQASAKGTDIITKAIQEATNSRMQVATALPPNYCESDDIGKAINNATTSSQITTDHLGSQSANIYNYDTAGIYNSRIATIGSRYASGTMKNQHIKVGKNLAKSKLETTEEHKAVIDGIDVMTANVTNTIDLNPEHATSSKNIERQYYLDNSGRAARLELNKATYFSAMASRVTSDNGESKISLIEKEIARTYGGNGTWRDELLQYADPTPLLAEANKQLSLTNYLLFEQLKLTEQQNLLLATSTIEQMIKNRTGRQS